MNRRLLITGAGGFLGSRICEYYSNRDGYEAVGVTHRELDIEDFVAVSAFIKAIRPDYVLHCAAISNTGTCERNPVLSEKVNVRGTINLAKACRNAGSRMIFTSSDQIYNTSHSMEPNREGSEGKPGNVYGRDKKRAEEFRLRAGHCLSVLLPEGERSLEAIVTTEELETLCDIAAEFSRYASIETLRQGFLPVRGGFRVGLCGSAVVKDGEVTNLKQISSAVIRISREQKGIAQAVAPRLFRDGRFVSTLLLSPPGGGKTTLLRDLVRQLSQGEGVPPQRITLIDEREEIAVMYRGQPQMDVGPRTDVLSGCPKALAIPMALRAMNPQIIAVDEITVREDLRAISQAAGCGVALLATIHAANVEELQAKPLYQELLAGRVFRQAVLIRTGPEGRLYAVENLP